VRAPRWTYNVGYTYDQPLTASLKLGLSTDVRYSSSYFTSSDESPYGLQKAYTIVDAAARVSTTDERWQLALIGRNLANVYYAVASGDSPGGLNGPNGFDHYGFVERPRQVTLEIAFRY
jgi:iron complex outermembrane receptor protein